MTLARLLIALGADASELEKGTARGVSALNKLENAVKKTGAAVASSRDWTKYRNAAERELETLEKKLERAQTKMAGLVASGKATAPFSRFSGEGDQYIKQLLAQGATDKQIEQALAIEEGYRRSSKGAAVYAAAQAEVNKYAAAIGNAKTNLEQLNQKIEESKKAETIAKQNAAAQKQFSTAIGKVEHGTKRSLMMFAKVAIGAASLYRLLRKLARAFWDSILANESLSASVKQIQGNLQIAWQAIFSGMIPALQALSSWLVTATNHLALFLLSLAGMTWQEGVAAANQRAASISGVGAAARKAKGDLASFDAINKLAGKDSGGGGGGTIKIPNIEPPKLPDQLQQLLDRIKESGMLTGFFRWLWNDVKTLWAEFGAFWTFSALKAIGIDPKKFVEVVGPWVSALEQAVQTGFSGFWNYVGKLFIGWGLWIYAKAILPIKTYCKTVFSKENLGAVFRGFWAYVQSVFEGAALWFYAKVILPIKTFCKNVFNKDNMGAVFSDFWDYVKSVFEGAGLWFYAKVILPIKNFWNNLWKKDVPQGVGGAARAIVDAFQDTPIFFYNLWTGIKNTFSTVGTTIANGIAVAFKAAINSVLSYADKTINGFIDNINKAIGLLNRLPGVHINTVKNISVPRLATGGVVDRPTMAVVGERGPEAVVPLNREFMRDFAAMLAPMLRPVAAGAGGGDVNVYLGNEPLDARIVRCSDRQSIRSNGRSAR